jgi:hypothetical protein
VINEIESGGRMPHAATYEKLHGALGLASPNRSGAAAPARNDLATATAAVLGLTYTNRSEGEAMFRLILARAATTSQ